MTFIFEEVRINKTLCFLFVKWQTLHFTDEWDDELRLKRNQLDVLQAHNRFIQTKEEINRRLSAFNLETNVNEPSVIQQQEENNCDSSIILPSVDINSNVKATDIEHVNEAVLVDYKQTSDLKGV